MMRTTIAAWLALLLSASPVAAQETEMEAPWDEDETMAFIETGFTEIAGLPDEDFCRTMAWLLGHTGSQGGEG